MKIDVPVRLLREAERALRRAADKRTTTAGLRLKMRTLADKLSRRTRHPSRRVKIGMDVLSKVIVTLAQVASIMNPDLASYLGS